MSGLITISGHAIGRRPKPLFDDFSIPFPPDLGDGGGLTLRDLITRIVVAEVEAFHRRQQERRLVKVLSPEQIDTAAAAGRIDMGGRDLTQRVDPEAAIATALDAFEDGLYLVLIDGQEQRALDAQVFVRPDSRVTFIRLVFLAGA